LYFFLNHEESIAAYQDINQGQVEFQGERIWAQSDLHMEV